MGGAYNVDGVLRARAPRVDGRLGRGPWFRLPSAWTWRCLLAEQPRVRFLLRFSSWFPFQIVPKSLLPLLDFSINQACGKRALVRSPLFLNEVGKIKPATSARKCREGHSGLYQHRGTLFVGWCSFLASSAFCASY